MPNDGDPVEKNQTSQIASGTMASKARAVQRRKKAGDRRRSTAASASSAATRTKKK